MNTFRHTPVRSDAHFSGLSAANANLKRIYFGTDKSDLGQKTARYSVEIKPQVSPQAANLPRQRCQRMQGSSRGRSVVRFVHLVKSTYM